MNEEQLIQKIQQLKKIQPNQEWVNLTRQILVQEINNLARIEEQLKKEAQWTWFWNLKPVLTLGAVLLFLLGGPWLTVKIAKTTLPGQPLYTIKKLSEEIQVNIAPEEKKAQIQIDLAQRRLEELAKINEIPVPLPEKTEKAKEVVNLVKDNLAGVSKHLKGIPKEKAVIVAKKTQVLKQKISQVKEKTNLPVKEELGEVEEMVEYISNQVLTTVLEGDNKISMPTTSSTETVIILEKEKAPSESSGEEVEPNENDND